MICQTIDIKKYNEANLVLKSFIHRSARLLPIFADLKVSGLEDKQAIQDFESIVELFAYFNYDDDTSKFYLNSDILERIRDTYQAIYNAESLNQESAQNLLSHFFTEYNKLLGQWVRVELN